MGPAIGDVDGDADDDLYVTAVGRNVLFRNDEGNFVDATEAAGVAGGPNDWHTAAGFFDMENDGDLDLLVGAYVRWSREIDMAGDRHLLGIPGRSYAPPMSFQGTQPLLFINRGDGVFDEGARDAGLYVEGSNSKALGKTMAYFFTDIDQDNDTDIFVANDTTRNFLYVNDGAAHFTEQGIERGLAYDRMGRPTGAMGVDGGVLEDNREALFVGNFAGEMSSAYLSSPSGTFFEDETVAAGLGSLTRDSLTFGVLFFDVNLDGRRDLLQINGHLEPNIDKAPGDQSYAQSPQLFLATGGQANAGAAGDPWLREVPTDELGDLGQPLPGRGVACADIDGDGDLDLLITQVDGPARLFRNDMSAGAHWLQISLEGRAGQTSVLGAQVEVVADGVTQKRRVETTRGYLAQSHRTLTFGLGESTTVDVVRVRWPDGSRSETSAKIDRLMHIVQPIGAGDIQHELNRAKAHLEAGRLGPALATLQTATQLAPDSAPTWRNLARAHMGANDPGAALEALDRSESLDPTHLGAAWIRAMALLRQDDPAQALPSLEFVVRQDPTLAAGRFQLATALTALGRSEDALIQLREAVRLDASHAAAHYQLAVASRRTGDMDAFRTANRDFLRLRELYGDTYDTPLRLEACRHMEAEPAGEAVPASGGRRPAEVSLQPHFAAPDQALLGSSPSTAAVGILSMNEHGHYVLLVAQPDGVLVRFDPTETGGYTAHEVARDLGDLSGVTGMAIGNFLDDSPQTLEPGTVPPQRPDVFLWGPSSAQLLQQQVDGSFRDVTARAGLQSATGTRALWVDYEQDGDLDLAVTGHSGLRIFVNRGDGSFEISSEIPDIGGAANDVVAVDFDDNGAVDLAVASDNHTTRIENRQAGRFVLPPDPPGPWPAAQGLLAEDLDLDGRPDAILIERHGVRFAFDGVCGPLQPVEGLLIETAVLFDPDGDGWLDLALGGQDSKGPQGKVMLLRNRGRDAWMNWTTESGLDDAWASTSHAETAPINITDLLAADFDGDGDSDLLARDANNALRFLINNGGEAQPLLKLRLLSLMSPSGATGARVEVRQGDFYTSRIVQSHQPVEIGVGARQSLDSILAVWPYGVVDTRTDVSVSKDGAPLAIIVLEKADTGSCPFLFVWDGETQRFINDMVGSGATDLPASREQLNPVNPHEIITIGSADIFPLVDGAWEISITSELREAAYFDEVALIVVDHPSGTELASTHRLRGPPFPENRVLALGQRVPLRSATGSDGVNRTDALRERDGVHGSPGPVRPPPLRGVCEPMTLEFDFGPLETTRPLVFSLSGFIEFGTASTLIAQSQHPDVDVIWPTLEVRDGNKTWQPIDIVVGLPGGKARDLVMELDGLLPEGADRLRLTTTFELHWDRAALFENVPLPADASSEVFPTEAQLHWRGFSDLAVRAPGQPRHPVYDIVTQTPPWRVNLTGWCTRYGDVLPLLREEDGKIIVLASGDEMLLKLPGSELPPVPEGCERTLMWRSVGYNKEADPNNAGAGNVWPLGPETRYGRNDEEEDAWRLKWNTRWLPPDVFRPTYSGTR
jgi:tetratricopeptide (TPR) repeat protein